MITLSYDSCWDKYVYIELLEYNAPNNQHSCKLHWWENAEHVQAKLFALGCRSWQVTSCSCPDCLSVTCTQVLVALTQSIQMEIDQFCTSAVKLFSITSCALRRSKGSWNSVINWSNLNNEFKSTNHTCKSHYIYSTKSTFTGQQLHSTQITKFI